VHRFRWPAGPKLDDWIAASLPQELRGFDFLDKSSIETIAQLVQQYH
jgi:hypothetical protein